MLPMSDPPSLRSLRARSHGCVRSEIIKKAPWGPISPEEKLLPCGISWGKGVLLFYVIDPTQWARVHINAVIGRWGKPSIGGALLLLVEGEHPDVGFLEIAFEVNGAIISG